MSALAIEREDQVYYKRTRTKPQAPRTLNCAILRLYGPDKFAISSLHCKVPIHLLSAASDSKSIDSPHPRQTPAPSFKSPYRNRLESSSSLPPAYLREAVPTKASDYPDKCFGFTVGKRVLESSAGHTSVSDAYPWDDGEAEQIWGPCGRRS